MHRVFAVAVFAVLLTACAPPSVEDFIEDPEMLGEVMEECQMQVAQGKPRSERCRNAQKAAETMAGNLMREALRPFSEAFKENTKR